MSEDEVHSRLQHVTEGLFVDGGAAGLPSLEVRVELRQVGLEPLVLLSSETHLRHHETHSCVRAAFQVLLQHGEDDRAGDGVTKWNFVKKLSTCDQDEESR